MHELGDRFGINRRTVGKILTRNGVRANHPGLTPDQVDEALRRWVVARTGRRAPRRHGQDGAAPAAGAGPQAARRSLEGSDGVRPIDTGCDVADSLLMTSSLGRQVFSR